MRKSFPHFNCSNSILQAQHFLNLANLVQGNEADNTLLGLGGDDLLLGQGGNDYWLYGGEGNDRIVGGIGNDYIDGGAVISVSAPKAAQTMGVGCRERSAAKRNVESRHLTPIGLRQCANRWDVLAARAHGNWLASHVCLQASNDMAYRRAA
jgi:RTX calcium-binding nonapeptide repeat (4 copies)